ncbi:hypothetical protein F5148DRAFT_1154490 [Russula earlei]|uniref:Uncharacterized protein n=1 Tax=Russula earlei TaxID=71964 RepID=A0ACC0TRJ6_9AGAM|nr:hypothetical protein F5148DRAFT_1154490 [Russula earlei]
MSTVPSDGDTSDSDHKAHEDAAPERAPKSDPHIRQTDRCRQFLEDTGDISDRVLQVLDLMDKLHLNLPLFLWAISSFDPRAGRDRKELRARSCSGTQRLDVSDPSARGDVWTTCPVPPTSSPRARGVPGRGVGNEVRGTREGERKMKEREGGRVGEGRAGGGECKSSCNDFATRTHF